MLRCITLLINFNYSATRDKVFCEFCSLDAQNRLITQSKHLCIMLPLLQTSVDITPARMLNLANQYVSHTTYPDKLQCNE
jgi:hypothetical protein